MIKAIEFPETISGEELDDYLSRGWYRMGQAVFSTDFIPVGSNIHRVHWLRLLVNGITFRQRQKRLFNINKHFSISVTPFHLSDELETLYQRYRSFVEFDAPADLRSYLLTEPFNRNQNIYDTYVIGIRDGELLIAAGIFDKGVNSIAGIMNFYHPDYRSRSLGKYLMLLKINLAIEWGMTYYYPGYIVQGFPKFDYKLFPDAGSTQYFEPVEEVWKQFNGLEDLGYKI